MSEENKQGVLLEQTPTQQVTATHVTIASVQPTTVIYAATFGGTPGLIISPKPAGENKPEDAWLGICPADAPTAVRLSEMFATIARYHDKAPVAESLAPTPETPVKKKRGSRRKKELQ